MRKYIYIYSNIKVQNFGKLKHGIYQEYTQKIEVGFVGLLSLFIEIFHIINRIYKVLVLDCCIWIRPRYDLSKLNTLNTSLDNDFIF